VATPGTQLEMHLNDIGASLGALLGNFDVLLGQLSKRLDGLVAVQREHGHRLDRVEAHRCSLARSLGTAVPAAAVRALLDELARHLAGPDADEALYVRIETVAARALDHELTRLVRAAGVAWAVVIDRDPQASPTSPT